EKFLSPLHPPEADVGAIFAEVVLGITLVWINSKNSAAVRLGTCRSDQGRERPFSKIRIAAHSMAFTRSCLHGHLIRKKRSYEGHSRRLAPPSRSPARGRDYSHKTGIWNTSRG